MRMLFALLVVLAMPRLVLADEPLAPVAHGQPVPQAVPPDRSALLYAYIGTGTTVALAATTVVVVFKRRQLAETLSLVITGPCDAACAVERDAEAARRKARINRYGTMTLVFGAATVVTGGVTAYLWTRATETTYTRPPALSLELDPRGGAQLAVAGSF
jgi:hypothetical protein